jgi:hypothetical protein
MRWGSSLVGAVAMCCLMASCSSVTTPTVAEVDFFLNTQTFATGDTLVATLSNASRSAIGYNLCFTGLEQRVGGQWQTVSFFGFPPGAACADIIQSLQPRDSAAYQHVIPATMGSGTYRLHITVEAPVGGASADVYSPRFVVKAVTATTATGGQNATMASPA